MLKHPIGTVVRKSSDVAHPNQVPKNTKGFIIGYNFVCDQMYYYIIVYENNKNEFSAHGGWNIRENEFVVEKQKKRSHKARQLQIGDTVQIIDKYFKDYLKKAIVVGFVDCGAENMILIRNIHDNYKNTVCRNEIRYIRTKTK